jgi:hypothetical protein
MLKAPRSEGDREDTTPGSIPNDAARGMSNGHSPFPFLGKGGQIGAVDANRSGRAAVKLSQMLLQGRWGVADSDGQATSTSCISSGRRPSSARSSLSNPWRQLASSWRRPMISSS